MFDHLPPDVVIYEVGPRDGLQNESRLIPTDDKIRFIDASQLPSEGFPINHYRFAAWTQLVQYAGVSSSGGISSVGSFAPESSMIPIGVLKNVAVRL